MSILCHLLLAQGSTYCSALLMAANLISLSLDCESISRLKAPRVPRRSLHWRTVTICLCRKYIYMYLVSNKPLSKEVRLHCVTPRHSLHRDNKTTKRKSAGAWEPLHVSALFDSILLFSHLGQNLVPAALFGSKRAEVTLNCDIACRPLIGHREGDAPGVNLHFFFFCSSSHAHLTRSQCIEEAPATVDQEFQTSDTDIVCDKKDANRRASSPSLLLHILCSWCMENAVMTPFAPVVAVTTSRLVLEVLNWNGKGHVELELCCGKVSLAEKSVLQ